MFVYNECDPYTTFGFIGWILFLCTAIALAGLHDRKEKTESQVVPEYGD